MSRDDIELQARELRLQLEIPPDQDVGIEYLKLARKPDIVLKPKLIELEA
jgi:hypothetical protein